MNRNDYDLRSPEEIQAELIKNFVAKSKHDYELSLTPIQRIAEGLKEFDFSGLNCLSPEQMEKQKIELKVASEIIKSEFDSLIQDEDRKTEKMMVEIAAFFERRQQLNEVI